MYDANTNVHFMPLNYQNEHEIHKQKTSTNQKNYSNPNSISGNVHLYQKLQCPSKWVVIRSLSSKIFANIKWRWWWQCNQSPSHVYNKLVKSNQQSPLSGIEMGGIQLAISRNGDEVHPTMFGMKVAESNHLQFLRMEEKNYMKQQHMGCYKTLQSLKP